VVWAAVARHSKLSRREPRLVLAGILSMVAGYTLLWCGIKGGKQQDGKLVYERYVHQPWLLIIDSFKVGGPKNVPGQQPKNTPPGPGQPASPQKPIQKQYG
jgi:hypothetical protein